MLFKAHAYQKVDTGNTRSPCARNHELHIANFFFDYAQAVVDCSRCDNRRTVLVVVKNGYFHALAQLVLDHKALGRLDVFEINTAERWLEARDNIDQFVDIGLVDLYIEHVYVGELLKQNRLAFHHRLRGQRAYITEPKHRRAVCDYRHQIAARGY